MIQALLRDLFAVEETYFESKEYYGFLDLTSAKLLNHEELNELKRISAVELIGTSNRYLVFRICFSDTSYYRDDQGKESYLAWALGETTHFETSFQHEILKLLKDTVYSNSSISLKASAISCLANWARVVPDQLQKISDLNHTLLTDMSERLRFLTGREIVLPIKEDEEFFDGTIEYEHDLLFSDEKGWVFIVSSSYTTAIYSVDLDTGSVKFLTHGHPPLMSKRDSHCMSIHSQLLRIIENF